MRFEEAKAAKAAQTMRKARRSPGEKLIEALCELAKGHAHILHHNEQSWASVTFAGTRHRVEMLFDGAKAVEAGECFIAFLPEHEFAIPRQIVADAAVVEVDHIASPPHMRIKCELLMLDEG